MKELRFFYTPDVESGELPKDEAQHALRVLRMTEGDELNLMDGKGAFHRAVITTATGHRCLYRIVESEPQQPAWNGHLCIAVAPTKLNDRIEWFAEKATEIGVDEFAFLDCQFSERRQLKTERVEKIVVSAVKQSHKAWMPEVDEMQSFKSFVTTPRSGQKFICHCYEQGDIQPPSNSPKGENCNMGDITVRTQLKPHLKDVISTTEDCTVLIGPEGDFSVEEVRLAQQNGYVSVNLGTSRLRTETAALVAVHIMQLTHQK